MTGMPQDAFGIPVDFNHQALRRQDQAMNNPFYQSIYSQMDEKKKIFHDCRLRYVELSYPASQWGDSALVQTVTGQNVSLFKGFSTLKGFTLKALAEDGFKMVLTAKTIDSSLRIKFVHEDMNFSFRFTDPNPDISKTPSEYLLMIMNQYLGEPNLIMGNATSGIQQRHKGFLGKHQITVVSSQEKTYAAQEPADLLKKFNDEEQLNLSKTRKKATKHGTGQTTTYNNVVTLEDVRQKLSS